MTRLVFCSLALMMPTLAGAQEPIDVEGDLAVQADVVIVDHANAESVVEDETTAPMPTQPPPPSSYAPPPSSYVPPPPNVQLEVGGDRQLLQARLSEHPLGGPITMFAIGVPVAAIFSVAAYYAYHVEDVAECLLDDCDGDPNRTATAVLGTIAGAGLVLGIVGLIKLISRVSHRARIRSAFARGQLSMTSNGVRLSF